MALIETEEAARRLARAVSQTTIRGTTHQAILACDTEMTTTSIHFFLFRFAFDSVMKRTQVS